MLKIGLEIHCQLKTATKLFSRANTSGASNTQVYPFDLGLPGSLPIINMYAVGMALKAALAFQCKIHSPIKFDRKHYHYPDLFVGYQITQKFYPIGINGKLLAVGEKDPFYVDIECIQLEQDTAKTNLLSNCEYLLDANRAGMPLIEIVTAPIIHSADDTIATLKAIQSIVRVLEISDGDLESGSFRCDVNISKNGNNRIELKNLNSFKDIQNAIKYESQRHDTEHIVQETRRWDPINFKTFPLRLKETTSDYKFLPDADIPILHIPKEVIDSIKIPMLPLSLALLLEKKHSIDRNMAFKIASIPSFYSYFKQLCGSFKGSDILKWFAEYDSKLNSKSIFFNESLERIPVYEAIPVNRMLAFLNLVVNRKVTGLNTKLLFDDILLKSGDVNDLSKPYLSGNTDISVLINTVITLNPSQYEKMHNAAAKDRKIAHAWLTGQVLKLAKGKADPRRISKEIADYKK